MQKNGKPFAEKSDRCPCRAPATVLGAEGVSLSGFAAFDLPICSRTGAGCVGTNSTSVWWRYPGRIRAMATAGYAGYWRERAGR